MSLLIATASAAAGESHHYSLQMPGAFHAGEPVAKHGEAWLALVVDAHGARLEEVVLSVLPVHDPVLDAPGEQSGLDVGADGVHAVAFLRGPDLAPGPVHIDLPEPVELGPGMKVRLEPQLGAMLALECSPFDQLPGDGVCTVMLSDDIQTSELAQLPATAGSSGAVLLGDEGRVQVLFVGDLNGDSATDLLIDVSDHYNRSRPMIFITQPDGNHFSPVRVAEYESVGC